MLLRPETWLYPSDEDYNISSHYENATLNRDPGIFAAIIKELPEGTLLSSVPEMTNVGLETLANATPIGGHPCLCNAILLLYDIKRNATKQIFSFRDGLKKIRMPPHPS